MCESDMMLRVQPCIKAVVSKFARANNLDRDELIGEANLIALGAVRKYDETRGRLESWVGMVIKRRFSQFVRFPGFRERYGKSGSELRDFAVDKFDLDRFVFELSEDAAFAVVLAIEEGWPADRLYIESVLSMSYGWVESKINRVFNEITRGLT